ncbi:unnamed protein product [Adineta ricciae]|uniref:Uncharacterized protein n=1 Tax=Adineta ricciae TaxID=249248 RepID=A0A815RXA3_ADIRI|nr:unnamed protein product [Adineta ricciae]CAF1588531.1 unnamed protein product [Adineta ricciae]
MVEKTYPNNDRYEGELVGGKRHGQGTLFYAKGGNYSGSWKRDERDGYGVNIWANGDRCEGNWKNNKLHGQVTFHYSDGESYSNEFLNGVDIHEKKPKSKALDIPSKPKYTKHETTKERCDSTLCPSMNLPYEFVKSLKWPESIFYPAEDKCYCSRCYHPSWSDAVTAGGAKYVIPREWVRFGLLVDPVLLSNRTIWDDWIVTFHGTTKEAAISIIQHRQFYLPGDKLLDGSILGIRDGHIPNQKFIFTSPTIVYSSSRVYAPIYTFQSEEDNRAYQAQIVLQCRQKPDSFKVQRETIGLGKKRICSVIPNEKMEYFTDIRPSVVIYGLLVRVGENLFS